jgi:hypothetical protein
VERALASGGISVYFIYASFVCRRVLSVSPNAQGVSLFVLDLSKLGENHPQHDTPYSLYTVPSKDAGDILQELHPYEQDNQVQFGVH